MTGWFGLRRRLAAAIAGVLLVALAFTSVAVHRGTESELRGRVDDDLRSQVDQFAGQLQTEAPTTPELTLAAARRYIASRSFGTSSQVFAVSVPGAGFATNQPDLLGVAAESEPEPTGETTAERGQASAIRNSSPGFTDLRVEDVGYVRLLTRTLDSGPGGPTTTVRVGEPLEPVERALDGLGRTFVVAGLAALGLGALAGVLLAIRIAAPLRRMAETAERVDAGDLSDRLPVPAARDELRTVAQSFNGMLQRLQESFARQRRFVADASHELRTPLTVIKGQLEVLARSRTVERADVQRVTGLVSGEVDRMERMVENLLELARSDQGMISRPEPVELGTLAREAFVSMAVTADRRFVVARADAGMTEADPGLISQLVRTLTRNAIEHTQARGMIRLEATAGPEGWMLAVDDDGPGIPEGDRAHVFERFFRTDASRTRDAGGTGLGLAIAKAIVDAHGGTITATGSKLGGARLVVNLPRRMQTTSG